MDLQYINQINFSTQSCPQSGQNVEKTSTRKGHGSAPNTAQPEIGVCTVPPRTPCIKKRPTHGSGGECSISTKRSRSRCIVKSTIVIPESICVHSGYFLSANTLRNRRKSSLVFESKRAIRLQLTSHIESERVAGGTFLKPEGASPRHAEPCLRRTAKPVVGQEGGQSTVDLACVDERVFVHQLFAVGDEVVKGPAHLLPAIVSLWRIFGEYCGGVVGGTPDDM